MEISKEELQVIEKRLNSLYVRYFKRIFDIFVSLLAIVVLSPVLFLIAIAIKITSPGPVIFKQERVGRNFKKFTLYKFRSMRVGSENSGAGVTFAGDPRITRIGNFLRKTKLDELPQFFNVLKGDMSLVGPRAVLEKFVIPFKEDYEIILKIRPGLTDYATLYYTEEEELLKGKGSTPDEIEDYYIKHIHSEKVKYYYRYLKEISFFTDIKILFLTAVKLIKGIWNRLIKAEKEKVLYFLGDLVVLTIAYIVTFLFRFDFNIPEKHIKNMWNGLAFFLPSAFISFTFFKIYRIGWRPSAVNLLELIKAIGLTFLLFALAVLSLRHSGALFASYPRSIIFLAPITGLAFIKGYRVLIDNLRDFSRGGTRTLIVGDPGETQMEKIITAFDKLRDFFDIVGILTHNEDNIGKSFDKRKVIGEFSDLIDVVESEEINSVMILPLPETSKKGAYFLRVREMTGKNLLTIDPVYYRTMFPDNLQGWIEPLNLEFNFRKFVYEDKFDESIKESISGKKALIWGGEVSSLVRTLIFQLLIYGASEIDVFLYDSFTAWELDRLFRNRCVNCNGKVRFHILNVPEDVLESYHAINHDLIFYLDTILNSEVEDFVPTKLLVDKNILYPYKLSREVKKTSNLFYLSGGITSSCKKIGGSLRLGEMLIRDENVYILRSGRFVGKGNKLIDFFYNVARGMVKIDFSFPDIRTEFLSVQDLAFALLFISILSPDLYVLKEGMEYKFSDVLKLIGEIINPSIQRELVFNGEEEEKLISDREKYTEIHRIIYKIDSFYPLQREKINVDQIDEELLNTFGEN